MEKYELEYAVNTSPKILYYRLLNPAGLEEWFADKVNKNNDIYTFEWEGSSQQAKLLSNQKNDYVRYQWTDIEDEDCFFELKIVKQEVTGDTTLRITDFADNGDQEGAEELWKEQVEQLKQILGV
ncbi:MAG: START-like domain-containing protein [Bacteroidota bacterium]|nr:START-like domain-containing protein [Bacteroidota bacterium]